MYTICYVFALILNNNYMSHKKAGSSTSLGRDSISKRLGVKKFDGQIVKKGDVIVKQRGTKFHPGLGVIKGGDDTIQSTKDGKVKFYLIKKTKFNNKQKKDRYISVE